MLTAAHILSNDVTPVTIDKTLWRSVSNTMNSSQPASPVRSIVRWLVVLPVALWAFAWLLVNGWTYCSLTCYMVKDLGWGSFLLLLSPCFYLWVALIGSTVWCSLNMFLISWGLFKRGIPPKENALMLLLVLVVPVLMAAILNFVGPYFYPLYITAEGHICLRMLPFLGGKGFLAY